MATISKVQICNMALVKIGQARIASLEQQDNKPAATCKLLYDQMVLETLEEHNWSFARKREALAERLLGCLVCAANQHGEGAQHRPRFRPGRDSLRA